MAIDIQKGKNDFIQCSFDRDLTDWSIRVKISDSKISIKKACKNVDYGGTDQISLDEKDKSIFYVHLTDVETINFQDIGYFEVDLESNDKKIMNCHVDKVIFL